MFNKEWMENMQELQKMATRLSEVQAVPTELMGEKVFPRELMEMVKWAAQNKINLWGPWLSPLTGSDEELEVQEESGDIYEPQINITESEKEIIVKAIIPGLKDNDDIDIKVQQGILHLKGRCVRMEGSKVIMGKQVNFNRSIYLPAMVLEYGIAAGYRDGVLTVACTGRNY